MATAPTESGPAAWKEAAKRHGTDKVRYVPFCWRHLHALESTAFKHLEIGVFKGGSLSMWSELFPKAELHAIDINPDCKQYEKPPKSRVHLGSQADPAFLASVVQAVGAPPAVIIDDGSHVMDHLRISFKELFPKLKPGGIYVLEDLGTCYMPDYGGELRHPDNMLERLKALVDNVNTDSKLGNPLGIGGIHFYDNIGFVEKLPLPERQRAARPEPASPAKETPAGKRK